MAAWNRPTIPDKGQVLKEVYASEARLSGFMVYSHRTGKWYTPDEFVDSDEIVYTFRNNEKGRDFAVRDPLSGLIEMKMKKVHLEQEIEYFSLKIKEYNKLKRKQTK